MKKNIRLFLLSSIVLLSLVILIYFNYSNKSEKKQILKETVYMENPVINTCSNNENVELQLRLLCNSNDYEIEDYNVKSSNDKVKASISQLYKSLENEDGSVVYTIDVSLQVPVNESDFDLNFNINENEFIVKKIHHINYNENNDIKGLEFLLYSPYMNIDKNQYFMNEIKFDNFDISDIDEYSVLGENIINVEKVNNKQVNIKTVNTKPAIVGYTYKKNDKNYCICNSYHTEALDKKK